MTMGDAANVCRVQHKKDRSKDWSLWHTMWNIKAERCFSVEQYRLRPVVEIRSECSLLSRKMILVGSVGWHDRRCRTLPINPTWLEDPIRLCQVMKWNLTAPLSGLSPPSVPFGKPIDEEVEADADRDGQSSEMIRRILTAWKQLINSRLVCNLPACCYPNQVFKQRCNETVFIWWWKMPGFERTIKDGY